MAAVAAIVWDEWASSCQAETLEISILLLPRAALMLGKASADPHCSTESNNFRWIGPCWGLKGKGVDAVTPAGLLSSSTSLNIYFSFTGSTQIEGGDVNQTPLIDCLDRPGLSGPVTTQAWVPAPLAAVQKGMSLIWEVKTQTALTFCWKKFSVLSGQILPHLKRLSRAQSN